jgi:4-amino-4-deoxy-L-arabinose transferase-like glycosyltransferase
MTPRRAVLLLAALLFLWRLGGHDLWAPDEPYFAEGAREMVADGEWAVPHVNGKVTADKPPLFFWLIALFSLPLGTVTSLTARLPSALAALGTVALTMRLGARFFGPRSAALAGVVLATAYLFWEKARWSQTDALLCCLVWVALSAFEAHRAGDASGLRAGLLFWLAAALAVLVKGPVGVLLPLGIALAVLATDRDLARWRFFAPLAGPLLFLAVIGAWMVLATVGGGGEYSVWGALREHFLERGVHGLHHRRPPWYFAQVLPPNLMPWTALLPGALALAWRRRGGADRFLLVAALFVVAFFTLSTEKRELYALPAVPAFALMVAALVAAVCGWEEPAAGPRPAPDRRWVTLAQGLLGGLLVLVGGALPFAAQRVEEVPAASAWLLAGLIGATGVATLAGAARGRALAAAIAPAAGFAAVYLFVVTAVYPAWEPRKSARPLAERLVEVSAESRARGVPVLAYAIGNLPKALAFYSNGIYTVETDDPDDLARHLERPEPAWAVADANSLHPLPDELLRRLVVVERTRLARKPILLLTNHPHPEGEPLLATAPAPSSH